MTATAANRRYHDPSQSGDEPFRSSLETDRKPRFRGNGRRKRSTSPVAPTRRFDAAADGAAPFDEHAEDSRPTFVMPGADGAAPPDERPPAAPRRAAAPPAEPAGARLNYL